MNPQVALNKNALVSFLGKPAADFTRDDIIRFITENGIEMVNFMYPAADGRLKTLNFVINSLEYLEPLPGRTRRRLVAVPLHQRRQFRPLCCATLSHRLRRPIRRNPHSHHALQLLQQRR